MRPEGESGRRLSRVLVSIAGVPGIARLPNYRSGPPIPAGEIELALLAFAILLAVGIITAVLWNRLGR